MQNWRIGIDVGGTNTDAVVIDDKLNLVASVKSPTTDDVMTGIKRAMHEVLRMPGVEKGKIGYAMLGTTHCTNAIVERKRLNKVAVLRIGAPATTAIRPMLDWQEDLKAAMNVKDYLVAGGNEFDGRELAPLDETKILEYAEDMKNNKVESVAVIAVYSPVSDKHEKRAREIIQSVMGKAAPVTLSNEIGSLGLLERENASILNAALVDVAKITAESFVKALEEEKIEGAEIYLCQNDGTLMSVEYAKRYPILTIACGPTNSIRGAAFLTGMKNAVVVDVGGTTTDVGVLLNGFPRESMVAVEIGGVRTNFRMPDIISVGLGGGSVIRVLENGSVTVGPDSVGFRVTEKALCFGGDTLTATDIVVALGLAKNVGDASKVAHLPKEILDKAYEKMKEIVEEAIDKMKTSAGDVDVILVGGGSILVSEDLKGAGKVLKPANFGVANAIGSAIGQVSGQIEKMFSMGHISRSEAIETAKQMAREEAVHAGANPDSVEIIDVEDVPMAYLGDAVRIRVKAVGDLKLV